MTKHRVDFHLFGALDFAVDVVAGSCRSQRELVVRAVRLRSTSNIRALSRHRRWAKCHLLGDNQEREVAGIVLDQKSNKTFVRAERRTVDAERDFVDVITIFCSEDQNCAAGEIDLVRRDGKLASITLHACTSIFARKRPLHSALRHNEPDSLNHCASSPRSVSKAPVRPRIFDRAWMDRGGETHQIFVDPKH